MASVAWLPAVALLGGALIGIAWPSADAIATGVVRLALCAFWTGAVGAWWAGSTRATLGVTLAGYLLCGVQIGATDTRRALLPPLRQLLDAAFGGFLIQTIGPAGDHPPLLARVRLLEDAALRGDGVSLRASVEWVQVAGLARSAPGDVLLTVNGRASLSRLQDWRGGRTLELPVTFRRPARYLNDGVTDSERAAALSGIALAGTVKSALLIDVVSRGTAFEEAAAAVRAHVRRTMARRVGLGEPVRALS